jgi:hypothetical protein
MAAWSNHEDSVLEPVMGSKAVVERVKKWTDTEPFPSETFETFSDEDIEQLVVDARAELVRRQGHGWGRSPYPKVWQS